MKKTILIAITTPFNFCIAKYIREKFDCDLYAFYDIDYKPKKFFKKQKILPIKKSWYFSDEVSSNIKNKPDLNFLKSFETKYQIDLWSLIYTERWFYKFNRIHTFTQDEILSLLEQECRLFETILDEAKPDFLIMDNQSSHHNRLLQKMCIFRDIFVLRQEYSRLAFRARIVVYSKKPIKEIPASNSTQTISPKELPKILKNYGNIKQVNFLKEQKINRYSQFTSILKFFIKPMDKEYTNLYSRVGKTKFNVLKDIIKTAIRKRRTRSYVNHNCIRNLEPELPFIYFPIHQEPEMSLLIDAQYYTNQAEVIHHIAKSIPLGYQLLIKDHPLGTKAGQTISFYKDLINLPNVKLIHPSTTRDEILEKCSLVITISGSAGFEAGFFGKPTIVLINTDYSTMPSVYTITKVDELPKAIKSSLEKKVDPQEVSKHVEKLFANSFEFDGWSLAVNLTNTFYTTGFEPQMNEVTESQIKSFIQDNNFSLNLLADEFIKKIQYCYVTDLNEVN